MPRARDVGFPLAGQPGPANAVTDVRGVIVGHVTIITDDPVDPHRAARTGVTAILPRGRDGIGVTAACGISVLNGNGEMTGSHWIAETGALGGPIMLTNTHAVGTVHRGVIDWIAANRPDRAMEWLLPVVAETWDGYLNAINEPHVTGAHAAEAIEAASSDRPAEGSVGGGTGMNCYEFSGGSGTSSRIVSFGGVDYVLGVIVQANFGSRDELTVAGVPVGDLDAPNPIAADGWFAGDMARVAPPGAGSVIVVVATDAPMLPEQCQALARRVPLGLARTGTMGSHFSGDLFLAFSTANPGALDSGFPHGPADRDALRSLDFVPWNRMDPFFRATVQAVEEAVLNCLTTNVDLAGRSGHWMPALPVDQVSRRLMLSGLLRAHLQEP
ncbi:MAG: P1 family peptidase [Actinomycetota bacterium]|nr:P1 family peptidase [Actinomycetota bacterium]